MCVTYRFQIQNICLSLVSYSRFMQVTVFPRRQKWDLFSISTFSWFPVIPINFLVVPKSTANLMRQIKTAKQIKSMRFILLFLKCLHCQSDWFTGSWQHGQDHRAKTNSAARIRLTSFDVSTRPGDILLWEGVSCCHGEASLGNLAV